MNSPVVEPHSSIIMSLPRHRRLVVGSRLLGGCAVIVAALAAAARGGCPEHDVWVVSTRRLPAICRLPAAADPGVERLAGSRWVPADLAALLDEPAGPLVIFIHGNRYEPGEAKTQGLTLARQLAAACPAAPPPRTVVFSWPSAPEGRLIPASRESYRRSYADGHYLGWLLGRVRPEKPVAIIGYSFGAVIAATAIDDLVEAEDRGTAFSSWTSRPGRTHLVFVAPALRCDALAPRGAYRGAAAGIDRLTLLINSQDLALRLFPHLDKVARADALGTVGMPRGWVPGGVDFSATDAAPIVGKRHALPLYLQSPALSRRIAAGAVGGLTDE